MSSRFEVVLEAKLESFDWVWSKAHGELIWTAVDKTGPPTFNQKARSVLTH